MTGVDEGFLAETFAVFVDEILDGGAPDVDRVLEARADLRERIEEIHELAHRFAGRQQPARPHFAGYDILSELGRGGMGTVFLARQRDLGRNVALKVVPPGVTSSASTARRFLDEARTLARLSDDRIVRIYNVIEHEDALAYAMEWVDGCSLRQLIDQMRRVRGTPTMADVANALRSGDAVRQAGSYLQYVAKIGIAMGRALGVVHRGGIVHRDVKPSNILIRRDGHALLADFGLAHVADSSLTASGSFLGTTFYASPEQLRATGADEIDGRSDVYSLAATLFEAVTRRPRYVARSALDVLRGIEDDDSPSLRKFAPEAPRDLDTILQRAMQPDPAERYQSADEFADDLERLLLLQPIHARPAGLWKRTGKFLRRQRRLVLATICGAAVVGVAWFLIARELDARLARHERANELVAAARSELLSSAGGLWHESARDRSVGGAGGPEPLAGDRPLRVALDHYARAASLVPDDAEVGLEQAVVDLAVQLGSVPADELIAQIRQWPAQPPLTVAFAQDLARGSPRPRVGLDAERLASAPEADRRTLGLLAFLIGNVPVCEDAWNSLGADPLANAALGLLHAADGNASLAYPRLAQAVRDFPAVPPLMLGLAQVAVDLGDPELAQHWLDTATESGAATVATRTRLVRAEIEWLRGDAAAARVALEALVADDATAVEAQLRLAQMDLAAGDAVTALALLEAVVRQRPHNAHFRRQLAEVALRVGDVRGYLAQARYVTGEILARDRSDHSIDELLDILRIGGMTGFYRSGLETIGRRPSLDRSSVLPEAWPDTLPWLSRERAESALMFATRFDLAEGMLRVPAGASGRHRELTTVLSIACRTWLAAPGLRALVGPLQQIAVEAGIVTVVAAWRDVVDGLLGVLRQFQPQGGSRRGWQRVEAKISPPQHSDHVLVADHTGLLLFGGIGAIDEPRGETWRWDGSTWRELHPATSPPARLRHAAAFDPERGRTVLFGGSRTKRGGRFADTWEFDGANWRQVLISTAPSPRNDHAMTWDPNTRRVLLFGGRDDTGDRDDTWTFDGTDWVELRPASRPPARRDHNLVTDTARDRLVLFGGLTATGRFPTAVWEWDGRDWCRTDPEGEAFARAGASAAFDPVRARTIAFGGLTWFANAGTVEWDGRSWHRSDVLFWPPGRSGHAMALDPISARLILFGGFSHEFLADTWSLPLGN